MRRTKRKLNIKKILLFIIIIIVISLLTFGIIKLFSNGENIVLKKNVSKYLASEINLVDLYSYNMQEESKVLEVSDSVVRGTKIETKGDKITENEQEYTLITIDEKEYYVLSTNLVDEEKEVVLEDNKFVRTSVTVYKNETDSKIESFIKKGNEVEVLGYDKLLEDGNVNMYQVKKDDITGWVYAKYLAYTHPVISSFFT